MPQGPVLHTDELRRVTSRLKRAEVVMAKHLGRNSRGETRPFAFAITVNGIMLTEHRADKPTANGMGVRFSREAFNRLVSLEDHCPRQKDFPTFRIHNSQVVLYCGCGTTVYDSTNPRFR